MCVVRITLIFCRFCFIRCASAWVAGRVLFSVKVVYVPAASTELLAQIHKWLETYRQKFRDNVVSDVFYQ